MTNLDGQIVNAKSLGLDWTKEDFAGFTKEMQAEGELSEEDLENVAGGMLTVTAMSAALAATVVATTASAAGGW